MHVAASNPLALDKEANKETVNKELEIIKAEITTRENQRM